MDPTPKRFQIALSFPGERRDFVSKVADGLAEAFDREAVLYDRFHEAEFARPNLGFYLPDLYRKESELNAVFLCAEYETKEWCGLEWRVLFDLIKQRRDAAIMLLRFDHAEISGLLSTDGFLDLTDRSPTEVTELILRRHALEQRRLESKEQRTQTAAPSTNLARTAPSRLRHAATYLFGRDDELAQLEAAWQDPQIHAVTLVAWGGVGKTSLVARWGAELASRSYDGARYFDWSFYSQGTREKGGPSSDAFVDKALRFFGDTALAESAASAWDKGARLARLVTSERTLLVLDGLEPLQHPPGPLAGQLQDPAITALLKGLAGSNPGLCVVTTRVSVADLRSHRETTTPEWQLGRLSNDAGVALLERVGVYGTADELETLVEDVRGHALTLNLLGEYLARAHGGDIRRSDQVALAEADEEIQGGHAFKAMDAYVAWLGAGGERGARQLAVLRLLGLFDRPASDDCIQALRAEPAVPGLTEPLMGLREPDWNLTVRALADSRLIAPPEPRDTSLDAHPLIREYFANELLDHRPDAWLQAHGRLFDHLQKTTEHQPDTLEGLQPLYQAVRHGCEANRHEEARAKVYRDRIQRGSEAYSTHKLGAIGADLGAIACFFENPWSHLTPTLSEAAQAWLLNEAAFRLRALGRLTEAVEPRRAGLKRRVDLEDWKNAAISANNLSELELTLGDAAGAVGDGEQSVAFADRSGDAFYRMGARATLADAQHQAGQRDGALASFRRAEAIEAEGHPDEPLLSSVAGFYYCDLLLADLERIAWRVRLGGRESDPSVLLEVCRDVEQRAAQTLPIAVRNHWILDIAFDHLTLGRAKLYRAIVEHPADSVPLPEPATHEADTEIEQAVDGLRRAGQLDYLPRSLLTRAHLRAVTGDFDGASADLDEAWEIAERGPMGLHMADIQLHRARLFRDRDALAEARRLIEKHGYGRRLEELEDAERALAAGRE